MTGRSRTLCGPFLAPGQPVLIAAPSGVVDGARLRAGLRYLHEAGHPTSPTSRALLKRHGYLAGLDRERASTFNALVASPGRSPILVARGGYGLTRILDRIDIAGLRRRPRLLLGYSDATALFMALQKRGPYLVLYGPMVSELGDRSAFDPDSLWSALRGEDEAFRLRFRASQIVRSGHGRGRLIGGCLSLLASLVGSRHDPDYRGAILFWEEVGEPPFRIDRMLTQLRNAGKLDHIRGMVIGSMTGCKPAKGGATISLARILDDVLGERRFPIIRGVPAGHIDGKITLPLGLETTLDTARRRLTMRPFPGGRDGRSRS